MPFPPFSAKVEAPKPVWQSEMHFTIEISFPQEFYKIFHLYEKEMEAHQRNKKTGWKKGC